jgi:hypothetical protein
MADYKACIECGTSYPATTANFHKSKDGFHARCRKCRNKVERQKRQKKQNSKLAEIERGAVDMFIASSRIGGANIPHSSELLEVLMGYFGGVSGFANAYMKQFYDAPVGGAFRTKMLDGVMRLITTNTAMGGAKKPLDLMTEEELEAQYRRDVLAAALSMKVNGNQVRIESNEDMRELPVVGGEQAGSVGGGVPPVSAAGEARDVGVPADRQEPGLRGVPPNEHASGQ